PSASRFLCPRRPPPPSPPLFPYTTLFRSVARHFIQLALAVLHEGIPVGRGLQRAVVQQFVEQQRMARQVGGGPVAGGDHADHALDRKSTRLNSSHVKISYAVFCLKKKRRM